MSNNQPAQPEAVAVQIRPEGKKQLIDITFENVFMSIDIKKEKSKEVEERIILNKVSGICKAYELTAILGASGAGKTTLLNILSCRIVSGHGVHLDGKVLANDMDYTFKTFPNFATYVLQDDHLLETQTVLECIQFAADLKVRGPQKEKNEQVNKMIRLMRLDHAKHTFIGGHFTKGVSGGERKRTSIAFELVCEPNDEPTSGLDSFTAFLLILALRDYSQTGKTVIFTIHQPSAEIWAMFNRIMLLVNGKFGPGGEDIIDHFKRMNFQCPSFSNPGDYFLSIMHPDRPDNVPNFPKYYEAYDREMSKQVQGQIEAHQKGEIKFFPQVNSRPYEVKIIAGRSFKNMQRNKVLLQMRLMSTVLLSLFLDAVYFHLSNGQNGTSLNSQDQSNKNGFLFLYAVTTFMFAMQPTILTFPIERGTFLKESNMRMYKLRSYMTGRTLPELPLQAILPLVSVLIIYWDVRLDSSSASPFFKFYLACVCLSLCGNSLGLSLGSIFKTPRAASAFMPMLILPMMLFAGFYGNSDSIGAWIRWVQYLTPFKYGFEAIGFDEYKNTQFIPNPIQQLDFTLSYWACIGLLLALFFAYRGFAFFFLWKNQTRLQ